ncbi:hypothetical protein quinque_010147 [Culex quinquefasciatus]
MIVRCPGMGSRTLVLLLLLLPAVVLAVAVPSSSSGTGTGQIANGVGLFGDETSVKVDGNRLESILGREFLNQKPFVIGVTCS